MQAHCMLVWCLGRPEEGVGPSGVGVTDAYDREGPLREQVFLATEPSLQPPNRIVEKCKRLQEEGSEADGAFEGGMKD